MNRVARRSIDRSRIDADLVVALALRLPVRISGVACPSALPRAAFVTLETHTPVQL